MDYIFRSIYNQVYTEGMFFLQIIMYLFTHYFDLLIYDIFTRVLNSIYVYMYIEVKCIHTAKDK